MSMSRVALVTLSINQGNPALSQDTIQLVFDGFPSTADLRTQLGEEKYQGLIDCCEADDISEFEEDAQEDGMISFECRDPESGKLVGNIVVEFKAVTPATTAVVD